MVRASRKDGARPCGALLSSDRSAVFAGLLNSILEGTLAQCESDGLPVNALDEARLLKQAAALCAELATAVALARALAFELVPQGSPSLSH